MKTIVLTLIGLGLFAQARSESLSTIDGATYDNITTKRVEPDGLYVEYTPAGGGLGMSKIKFARLSPEQQKQFGYDAEKARDYETKTAKANEDWRQEMVRSEQAAKAQRQADEARADAEERVANDHLMALAQLKQAEADLARSQNGENYGGSSFFDGGGAAVAIPEVANDHQRKNEDEHSRERLFPRILPLERNFFPLEHRVTVSRTTTK